MNLTTAPAVFSFQEHPIRTIVKEGEAWFVAADVCETLAIRNPTQAMARLDDDERAMFNIGRQGEVNIISESGLYSLVMRSRKEAARKFRKWVTSEVLPAIRKTGEYRVQFTTTANDVLTASQAEQLRLALNKQSEQLPKEQRGDFLRKGWSKLKSHFGVSYRKIPQAELTEALSIIGRHAAQWEVVDSLPEPVPRSSYHYPLDMAKPTTPGFMDTSLTAAALLDARNRPLEIELLDQLEKDGHDVSGVRARIGAMRLILELSEMSRKRIGNWERRLSDLVEEFESYKAERGLAWSMAGSYLERSVHR